MSEHESTLDEFVETDSETNSNESQELFGLGKIPADWEIKPLSESAQIIPGNSPPSSTYNENKEGLPFFQGNSNFGDFHPKADTWCSDPRKEAEINDVLISIRAPVGDLNIADTHCCIGRGLAALRPNDINGLYLYYNLAERKIWLSRLATGSTFKAVSKTDLQLLDIPIPSLREQRKIATVLRTVDQAIANTKKLIKQKKRLRDAVAQESLVLETNSYTRPTEWGKIPASWEEKTLENICQLITDGTHMPPERTENGIPLIGIDEIEDIQLDFSGDLSYISEQDYEEMSDSNKPNKGDVLVAVVGATIGKSAIVTNKRQFAIQRSLGLLRTNDTVLSRFLHTVVQSPNFKRQLDTRSRATAQAGVYLEELKQVRIPVPPIKEQEAIADRVDAITHSIRNENEYLRSLNRFKRGLMQDLLSGTVRTTDTNITVPDEVAQYG